ncbi:MAG: hypothetical protein ACI4C7_08205 [Clostridia bacterium]
MPIIKFMGYAHKEGSFTDDKGNQVDFNSITLDLLTDTPMDNDCVKAQYGMHCASIKIKHPQLRTLFPPEIKTLADLNSWVGKEIRMDYSLLGAKPVLCGIELVKK